MATDTNETKLDLNGARDELARTIETAGLDDIDGDGQREELVKVGDQGLSIELRFNGQTIALAGQDVNTLPRDGFQDFLAEQRRALLNGDYDVAIERALAADGPGKALVRVRVGDVPAGDD